MAKQKAISIWDSKIIRRALVDSFIKLNPIAMMKKNVMFVVEVGSVLTTVLLIRNIAQGAPIIGIRIIDVIIVALGLA